MPAKFPSDAGLPSEKYPSDGNDEKPGTLTSQTNKDNTSGRKYLEHIHMSEGPPQGILTAGADTKNRKLHL